MLIPYLVLALGSYLLYEELKQQKGGNREEKRDSGSGGADSGRASVDDPGDDGDRVRKVPVTKTKPRKEKKNNVQQNQSHDDPGKLGDTDGGEPCPQDQDVGKGGLNDGTVE